MNKPRARGRIDVMQGLDDDSVRHATLPKTSTTAKENACRALPRRRRQRTKTNVSTDKCITHGRSGLGQQQVEDSEIVRGEQKGFIFWRGDEAPQSARSPTTGRLLSRCRANALSQGAPSGDRRSRGRPQPLIAVDMRSGPSGSSAHSSNVASTCQRLQTTTYPCCMRELIVRRTFPREAVAGRSRSVFSADNARPVPMAGRTCRASHSGQTASSSIILGQGLDPEPGDRTDPR